jgi:sialic acid synthase
MQIKLKNGRVIGDKAPVYIIAEVGINHNGDFELAKKMIEEAAKTGIDAIKFQKRTVDEMYIKSFLDKPYNKDYAFGATYGEHKKYLEFDDDQFLELKKCAKKENVDFIVSGFDYSGFDFIDKKLNVDIHKIASPFVTHYPLLKQVACYGKPMIVSTGMHTRKEIYAAVNYIKQFNKEIILLQATTLYPCPDELVNLNVLKTYRKKLNVLVGYSSHDRSVILPAASVALGGCVIEKHFTLDRTMKGPDHAASVETRGLELIVNYAHCVDIGLGNGRKMLNKEEKEQRKKYGVSIVSRKRLSGGHVIREDDITVKCPGGGISPVHFNDIIGKRTTRNIPSDEIIYRGDVE